MRPPRTLAVEVLSKDDRPRGAVFLRAAVLGVTEDGPGRCILTLRTGRDVRVALDLAEVCARLGWSGAVALGMDREARRGPPGNVVPLTRQGAGAAQRP